MKNRPLLSISMLVSGKSKDMWKSIESIISIKERISTEIILIDTGCTKEVHSRLEKKADKLLSFTWCDDFAKARNTGVEVASGEWFMYLDDDEWFEDLEGLVEFFQSGMYKEYGYACYKVRNYIDPEGTQYSDSWVERLARRTESLTFQSKIHEFLTGKEGEKYYLPLVAEHYGYAFASEEEKIAHFNRNEKLLLEMKKEEPHNLRWDMQLVQEYRTVELYDKIIDIGKSSYPKAMSAGLYRVSEVFLLGIVIAMLEESRYKEAFDVVNMVISETNISLLAKTHAYLLASKLAYNSKDYILAYNHSEHYIQMIEYFTRFPRQRVEQEGYPFVGEALDEIRKKEGYSIAICSGLRNGNLVPLDKYMNCLKWNERNVFVYETIAEELLLGIRNIGYAPEFYRIVKIISKQNALKEYFILTISKSTKRGEDNEIAKEIFSKVDEANEIVHQILLLKKSGLERQAKTIIEKMKTLLPDDPEIMCL